MTDFASFYSLPSTINAENLEKPIHSILQSAFSFYNVATSVSLSTLMYDVITLAKKVYIFLDIENAITTRTKKHRMGTTFSTA